MSHALKVAPIEVVAPAVRPLHAAFGVEIGGLDIAGGVSPAGLAMVQQALRDHLVVVLREQDPSPAAQLAFTAQLGALQRHPLPAIVLPELPDVVLEEPGRDTHDLIWHADLAWSDTPNRYSLLASAGMTGDAAAIEFASQVAAYESLDPWLRDRIEYLEAEHDHARRQALGLPLPRHPLVRIEPENGRRSLMPGGATARRIVGLACEESDRLLHRLRSAATDAAVLLSHRWRAGDVVLWDNLAVLHRQGTLSPLRLHRTMVRGARPVGPAALTTAWVSAG